MVAPASIEAELKKRAEALADRISEIDTVRYSVFEEVEQALRETRNEMADQAIFVLEDGTVSGEFYAAKIRALKVKP